ncbi:GNAT family N-acetyltransferase [Heliobacterium chlorum]|uniref:GNAT family N-acetyltransferase n=1 Tax=Heliobacterium chlorum TaxID=2698 RepID=A0ABR7T2I7_HELCL|nr:GNAT family N-acetyltransferase [Heliobacterium chlorum]MBC9784983.1 GNAT family N-acetyltransferase [Heliobacterium chlorum]
MLYEIINHLNEEQLKDVFHMCKQEWWGKGREYPDFKRAVENSNFVVAFTTPETNKVIAFARVITDFAYKAILLDVIVESSYRKTGLGRELMEYISNHPKLKSVYIFDLFCMPDLVPFYEKWGFVESLGEVRCMRRISKLH